jgi:hypothetical protein
VACIKRHGFCVRALLLPPKRLLPNQAKHIPSVLSEDIVKFKLPMICRNILKNSGYCQLHQLHQLSVKHNCARGNLAWMVRFGPLANLLKHTCIEHPYSHLHVDVPLGTLPAAQVVRLRFCCFCRYCIWPGCRSRRGCRSPLHVQKADINPLYLSQICADSQN